jgi:2-amino-4-hydroxy-6-hydroxymethyldihydropteridine diphosphokinase
MSEVFLSLGTNIGDRMLNLNKAKDLIALEVGEVVDVSGVYETPPLGFVSESFFYNICIKVHTKLSLEKLLVITQEIEKKTGRKTKTITGRYESRVIDIDIIFYNDLIFKSENLMVPHEHFKSRMFVLKPMNDIAPDFIDPETNNTVGSLMINCLDDSKIKLIV